MDRVLVAVAAGIMYLKAEEEAAQLRRSGREEPEWRWGGGDVPWWRAFFTQYIFKNN